MARKFFYVCAGLFLLALSYNLGARSAGAQSARAGISRYELFQGYQRISMEAGDVDLKLIMKLDTATGAVTRYRFGPRPGGGWIETWLDTEQGETKK